MQRHICKKKTEELTDFIFLCTVAINFQSRYPSQMKFFHISGISNIVMRMTNVRQPLNSLKSLATPSSVAPSRDNTYRIRFRKNGSEHLIANGQYCDSSPKEVQLDEFQKQLTKRRHAGLSTLKSIMY